MNLPNALTIFRILLIPAFTWAYFSVEPKLVALILYLVASFTDFLDGYLARKWNQITDFGKLMDPLADKLMLVTLLVCLAITGNVPWWIAIVMFSKELLMLIGSVFMLKHKVVVSANIWGKMATFVFIFALALVFPWHNLPAMYTAGDILLYVAVGLSVLSMIIYAVQARENLKKQSA